MDLLCYVMMLGALVSLSKGCDLSLPGLMKIEALLGGVNVSNLRYTCLFQASSSSRYSEFAFVANISDSIQQPRVTLVQLICADNDWKVEDMRIAGTDLRQTFPTRGECGACTSMISTLSKCDGNCWDAAYLTTFPSSASDGSNVTCERTFMTPILYTGVIVSTVCLMLLVIFCTYLSVRYPAFRPINILHISYFVAVIGVNISFIGSVYSIFITPLCATVAVLLHYFLLVALLSSLSEVAFLLLLKIRKAKWFYLLLSILGSWVLPPLIVAVCIGPDYTNYTSGRICRPVNLPFYIGLFTPIAIVPPLIWILVLVIIFLRNREENSIDESMHALSTRAIARSSFCAVLSSLVFSLAWIFGLETTALTPLGSTTRTALMIVFIILSALHGLLLLLLHCIKQCTENRRAISQQKDDETIPFIEAKHEPSSTLEKPPVSSQMTPLMYSSGRQPSRKRMNVLPASSAGKSTTQEQMKQNPRRMEIISNAPSFKLKEESINDDGDDFSD